MTPDVSVLMPVYNGMPYLKNAVESILSQTYKEFEFIIINDGSTDDSAEYLANVSKQDPRIRLVNQQNKGLVSTLNYGVSISKCNVIARMDADDISVTNRLEKQKGFMDQNPDIAAVGTATIRIDKNGNRIGTIQNPTNPQAVKEYLHEVGSPIAHPTVMFRKKAFESVGGYRENYEAAEDYDLWLRMAKEHKITNLAEPLLYYREHGENISVKKIYTQRLRSAIARVASSYDDDPTEKINDINFDTFDKFPQRSQEQHDRDLVYIIGKLSGAAVLSPDQDKLEKIIQKIDSIHSARNELSKILKIYSKLAYTSVKVWRIDLLMKLTVKALKCLLR